MTSPARYFMDDTREAKRLADKVDAAEWVTRHLTPHLDGTTARVLDVGCGAGAIVAAAARKHPTSHFTGIDLHGDRFEAFSANAPTNANYRVGDALSLPFADGTFDIVCCRFLLEYLSGRAKGVTEMVRVCKAGGRVILQDLDGQLVWHYPEDPALSQQLGRAIDGLAALGFDPFVGRKLFSLARSAGLKELSVSAESYHLFAGRIDPVNEQLWQTKLDIALPTVAKVLTGADAAKALRSRLLDYLRRDDTLTYSILFTVVGQR